MSFGFVTLGFYGFLGFEFQDLAVSGYQGLRNSKFRDLRVSCFPAFVVFGCNGFSVFLVPCFRGFEICEFSGFGVSGFIHLCLYTSLGGPSLCATCIMLTWHHHADVIMLTWRGPADVSTDISFAGPLQMSVNGRGSFLAAADDSGEVKVGAQLWRHHFLRRTSPPSVTHFLGVLIFVPQILELSSHSLFRTLRGGHQNVTFPFFWGSFWGGVFDRESEIEGVCL